jgi:hypothetical protein
VLRGVAFSKIIGWKAILYPTTDPFLMLKLGGNVMEALMNNKTDSAMLHNNSVIEEQIISVE